MHHSILQNFFADSCIDNHTLYNFINQIHCNCKLNSKYRYTHKQGSENDHAIVFNLIKTACLETLSISSQMFLLNS